MITLKGLTWDHPRAIDGLVAATREVERTLGTVRVTWDTHSLDDFSANPIGETIGDYDFVIYDHPFIGDVSRDRVMLDLSRHLDPGFIAELEADAVGYGVDIYRNEAGLWALPIDAACQVAAFRPDLCARAGLNTESLRDLPLPEIIARLRAAGLKLAISFAGVGALMSFFTICYKLGASPFAEGRMVPPEAGHAAIATMHAIIDASPHEVLDWISITALEEMARRDDLAFCPYIFGFSPYAMQPYGYEDGRRPLVFNASPAPKGRRTPGGIIGGAGIGISARTKHPEAAATFLMALNSRAAHVVMAANRSQPGRRSTWLDPKINHLSLGFYRNTLEDIDQGYIRPRVPDFVARQTAAGACLEHHLRRKTVADAVLADLEEIFAG